MKPIDIQAVMKLDKEEFLTNRRYIEHNIASFEDEMEKWERVGDSNDNSACANFQEHFSTEDSLYDWRHEIESEKLFNAIESLTPAQLKLLHLNVFWDLSAGQIAKQLGVTRSSISNRLIRIRKKLKKLS